MRTEKNHQTKYKQFSKFDLVVKTINLAKLAGTRDMILAKGYNTVAQGTTGIEPANSINSTFGRVLLYR